MVSTVRKKLHAESHLMNRVGWLRATVLGANDGILSIASILSGMAAGHAPRETILLAGLAAIVAGATSMATGEYVSVSSQSDMENADLTRERKELASNPAFELEELAQIYVARGVELPLARAVADQLMKHDALAAHAHDELGISEMTAANPLQAALASAASFTAGGAFPLGIAVLCPESVMVYAVVFATMLALLLLGVLGAKTGGAGMLKPTLRVVLWGAISLGLTTAVGLLFDVTP